VIDSLPRREREIFEILCRLGEASAAAVRGAMAEPPTDSAVRVLLRRLEARGLIDHRVDGQAFIFSPVARADTIAKSALHSLVQNFFRGSAANAATALLGMEPKLKPDEIEALQRVIDQARRNAK
jgi:predicted transcriptional regulator